MAQSAVHCGAVEVVEAPPLGHLDVQLEQGWWAGRPASALPLQNGFANPQGARHQEASSPHSHNSPVGVTFKCVLLNTSACCIQNSNAAYANASTESNSACCSLFDHGACQRQVQSFKPMLLCLNGTCSLGTFPAVSGLAASWIHDGFRPFLRWFAQLLRSLYTL